MRFIRQIVVFSVLFFAVSCAYWKAYTVPMEQKVLDTWKFEEVLFRKNLSFSAANETEQFKGITLTFKEDHEVLIHTAFDDKPIQGQWSLEKYSDPAGSENGAEGQQYTRMRISFNDDMSTPVEWSWDRFSVSRDGISCVEWKNSGHYSYRLVRNR